MSSILDALKKSDQQRSEHAAASPYLHTGSGRKSGRRRRWRLPLIVLLLLATAVIWWWLAPDSRTQTEVTVVSSAKTPLKAAPAQPEPAPDEATEAAPSPETPEPGSEALEAVALRDDQVLGVEPTSSAVVPQAELPASEALLEEPASQPPRVEAKQSTPTSSPTDIEATSAVTEPRSTSVTETQSESGPLVQLSQLSAEYRAALNALKISIVLYDPEPARAFAIINGERMRVGDQVLDGVNLSQITREGLILDVDGQRVLMSNR